MPNDNNNIQTAIIDSDYTQWLVELKTRYRQAQIKAASRVNEELLRYYWQLGADIDARGDENRYGARFYYMLSHDLMEMMPGVEGFTRKNLQNATRFYRFYSADINRKQLVSESTDDDKLSNRQQVVSKLEYTPDEAIFRIPWGHHIVILGKCANNQEKALFYVHKTLENQWSRAMLLNMMGDKDGNNGLYETQGKALTNFAETLPKPDTDLARAILKDPYNLQFLRLYENYQEQDLQLALEQNIVQFLLELGNGFAFVGRQKEILISGVTRRIDLLFYHIRLRCYVVVELKAKPFEPEFASKLNFYVNAVNRYVKASEDNPTLGLLVCTGFDKTEVALSFEGIQTPLGVATYNGIRVSDVLPSEELLRQRVRQLEQELRLSRKLIHKLTDNNNE